VWERLGARVRLKYVNGENIKMHVALTIQGYLAHKKQPPPLGTP